MYAKVMMSEHICCVIHDLHKDKQTKGKNGMYKNRERVESSYTLY